MPTIYTIITTDPTIPDLDKQIQGATPITQVQTFTINQFKKQITLNNNQIQSLQTDNANLQTSIDNATAQLGLNSKGVNPVVPSVVPTPII